MLERGCLDFVAVDVETANADVTSICQIGIVRYKAGVLVAEWESLVDPQDYFDAVNVSIHGINEGAVAGAPEFSKIAATLASWCEGAVVVSHTHFDRVSLTRSWQRHGAIGPQCEWLDTARVARRTWPECARKGYGLSNVCGIIGYVFDHHNALEDAKAAAQVLMAASETTGLDVHGWLMRVRQPIGPMSSHGHPMTYAGNPDGPMYGEVLVFTGALSMLRREAADCAARVGCQVESGVTKRTTLLVVGDHDVLKLRGHLKSSKHRKAEALIAEGAPIRILRESDFSAMVSLLDKQNQSLSDHL